MEKKEIRMFDDPSIVEYRTNLEGWTGADGLYHGKGEEGKARAIYANHTHKKCECGIGLAKKGYTICDECISKKQREDFEKLDCVEWDGVSAMCLKDSDKFFFHMEDVDEYCEDEEIDIKELELMLCEQRVDIDEVNIDELNEEYCTENGEGVSHFHPEIAEKVAELNELIKNAKPVLWFPTKTRIKI